MLIPDEVRKCVTYLCVNQRDENTQQDKVVPAATAFFVGVPVGNTGGHQIYVVTARHVIANSRPYGDLICKMNAKSGGLIEGLLPQDKWTIHPTTDVAVAPFMLPENADIRFIGFEMLSTSGYVDENRVGIGDNVFVTGLFTKHPGELKIQPIVRFGVISMMPREKITAVLEPQSTPSQIDAYLVEMMSWGGHSGSPAFIYYRPDRDAGTIALGQRGIALLGLVHGHYEINQEVQFIGDIPGEGSVPLHSGISAIVPAQDIIDLLMDQELVRDRLESLKLLNG